MRETTLLLTLLMLLFFAAQQSEVKSLNEGWQFTLTNTSEDGDDHRLSAAGWYAAGSNMNHRDYFTPVKAVDRRPITVKHIRKKLIHLPDVGS